MSGITIDLSGIDEAIAAIDSARFSDEINAELRNFGLNVVTDAKLLCPVDEGLLRSSISATFLDLAVTIVASANYAAYVEFGTRKFAAEYVSNLPDTWQEFASQFKGTGGGSFDDFILLIKEWIQRKGLSVDQYEQQYDEESGNTIYNKRKTGKAGKSQDEKNLDEVAYLIARKIALEGMPAQPFLYPSFEKNRILLIERLKKLLS